METGPQQSEIMVHVVMEVGYHWMVTVFVGGHPATATIHIESLCLT